MENTENQEPITDNQTNEQKTETDQTDNLSEQHDEQTDKKSDNTAVWQDKYVRLSAEFDNFRKRTLKEKMDLIESGGEKVLKAFLAIADDMERAINVLPQGAEREGMELILKKFLDTLRAQNVTPIESLGMPLNVDFHDAIAKLPADSPEKNNIIVDVVQTGYMLGEKVLRHAKVVVAE